MLPIVYPYLPNLLIDGSLRLYLSADAFKHFIMQYEVAPIS
jgi:hypothetical protein